MASGSICITYNLLSQGSGVIEEEGGRKILRARGGGWVTTKPTVFQSQYSSYLMGITECIKPIQVQSIPKVSVEQEVGTNSHLAAEELWVTDTCQKGKVSFP